MALNKNALIRYRTIDRCLQNNSRKWTLKNLIDACSDALYEYEGKQTNVSKRTVQLDIEMMRGDKLGYNAPIEVYERKYYRYSDLDYSITDIPLTSIDLDVLAESVTVLQQFKDFSLFSELSGVIQKLEDKIFRESAQQQPIIHIDKNEHLKGLAYLDLLYRAILNKISMKITYRSFHAEASNTFLFYGYILKEFNNRWFLVGKRDGHNKIMTLALDRMLNVEPDLNTPYEEVYFNANEYYSNTFGVTVLTDKQLINVEIEADRSSAPYILTKPLHHSQRVLRTNDDGSIIISIRLHHNYELERLIIGFADSMKVLKPDFLRRRIKSIFERAYMKYDEETGKDV